MKKARLAFMRKPYLFTAVAILVLIIIFLLARGGGNGDIETIEIKTGTYENRVTVSGKVKSTSLAELGFDQSGRVIGTYFNVGDAVTKGAVIGAIENGDIVAEVMQRTAALEREAAKLRQLRIGTRPEELAVYEQKYNDASSALVFAMRASYLKIEGAIANKADDVFDNAQTVNPTLNIRAESENIKRNIELSRLQLTESLQKWKNTLGGLTIEPSTSQLNSARTVSTQTMLATKSFLDKLGNIVRDLNTNNSGLAQSVIDEHRSNVNSASQDVADAASSYQTADAAWSNARDTLNLQKSGSTANDISAQEAEVRAKEADLAYARARLAKTQITAPFDGIVAKNDLKIGEIVSPNTPKVTVMSTGAFEIESFIPEVNIAKVALNNPAKVTLDAYGETVPFETKVIAIDPAETLRDGVSTYKVRLQFSENDQRIKSGMTASVNITTESKDNAYVVPQGVVFTRDGNSYVQVLTDAGIEDRQVTMGSTSSIGTTEIISGVRTGDRVLLNPQI